MRKNNSEKNLKTRSYNRKDRKHPVENSEQMTVDELTEGIKEKIQYCLARDTQQTGNGNE